MHTWLRRLMVVALLGATLVTVEVAGTSPVAAAPGDGPCLGCGNADVTDAGLLARARTQMNELNTVQAAREVCNDEDDMFYADDGNDTVEHTGFIRWRLTLNEQTVWDDDDTTTGYRLECWLPTAPDRDGLIDVQIFDAISPQVLAQVAIDNVLAQIPTQEINTSPGTESLVAIDTWFWVTGVPEGGVTAVAEVPFLRVVATATPGGVEYDFGDGTGLACAGEGIPYTPGATSDCTHTYERAASYTVTSTIMWTGSYTLNGNGPYPITAAIPRTNSFTLPVSEAQAINTDD